MYKIIFQVINEVIKCHETWKLTKDMTERDRVMFINGLNVAKQLIEQIEEDNKIDFAYETLEDTIKFLKDNLNKEEVIEIVESIFDEEE